MTKTTKTIIHVFLPQGFADWEVGLAMAYLNQHPHQFMPTPYTLRTVAETRDPVRSMGGLTLLPDLTLDEVQASGSALLILPGGTSWDAEGNAAGTSAAGAKARAFAQAGVPVAAICGGTAGLARAGLLDDRRHTSNAAEYLVATGYKGAALYEEAPVVRDRGVITAASTAPVAFALAIFEALNLYTPEVRAAWSGLFSTGEARHYHALVAALKAPSGRGN